PDTVSRSYKTPGKELAPAEVIASVNPTTIRPPPKFARAAICLAKSARASVSFIRSSHDLYSVSSVSSGLSTNSCSSSVGIHSSPNTGSHRSRPDRTKSSPADYGRSCRSRDASGQFRQKPLEDAPGNPYHAVVLANLDLELHALALGI